MLKEYVGEFERLHARATVRLQALQESPGGPAFGEEAKAVEALLEEMDSNRRQVQVQLRLELSEASGDARQAWEQRVKDWARVVSSLRASIDAVKAERARSSLQLSGGGANDTAAALAAARGSAERQSAVSSTDRLHQSTLRLDEARRMAIETEAIGEGVLTDLAAQRDTIQHVRDNMRVVGSELNSARRSLDRLIRTAQQNRVVTMLVMFVLGVGLAFWGLMVLGLPLKWNIVLAVALVLLGVVAAILRRRCQKRREAREALAAPSMNFWRSMV